MSDLKPAPPRLAVIAAFAALYLIWGSTYLGIRLAIESIPPLLMAGVRFFLAGIVMYVIARWQGAPKSSFAEWRTAFVVGAACSSSAMAASRRATGPPALLASVAIVRFIALLCLLSGAALVPGFVLLGLAGGFVGVAILVGRHSPPGRSPVLVMPAGMLILRLAPWSSARSTTPGAQCGCVPFLRPEILAER